MFSIPPSLLLQLARQLQHPQQPASRELLARFTCSDGRRLLVELQLPGAWTPGAQYLKHTSLAQNSSVDLLGFESVCMLNRSRTYSSMFSLMMMHQGKANEERTCGCMCQ